MDDKTIARINALQVAVRVLDGQAGGYSSDEKYQAKLTLMDMILKEEGRQIEGATK